VGNLVKLRSLYLSRNEIEDLAPLANLRQLWSLYLAENQIKDISPLKQLKDLYTLDLNSNHLKDLGQLRNLVIRTHLLLEDNEITDLSVLVEMGKQDRADSPSFSLFWSIYLTGNPLSEDARQNQLEKLREVAKSVTFEE
jgi:Leucine-rich repeat (LRR) protein